MQLALLASAEQWEQWGGNTADLKEIIWVPTLEELVSTPAEVYVDLLFEAEEYRIAALSTLLPHPVVVNAVTETLAQLPEGFVRMNGWPGVEKRKGVELVWKEEEQTAHLQTAFSQLGKTIHRVPDVPGMVSPRVIAMIVNEAFFALGEGVSTRDEMDTAMKLGTNYPLGPFAWGAQLGLENIYGLLKKLSETDERCLPAPALELEMKL